MINDALPSEGETKALLGRGTRFEGKLYFEGSIRLDGMFKGEIHSEDTLVVGEGAEVDAEIEVATVVVRGGTVRGNIRAKTSVEIHAPGKLIGNVHTPSLLIEKGVLFQGSCTMEPLSSPEVVSVSKRSIPSLSPLQEKNPHV